MKAIRQCTAVCLMVQMIVNTVLTPWVLAVEPIEVDPTMGQNTQVYTLNSGTSVVDIASANGAGFSDNYFRSYSVPNAGVVVNNNLDSAQASRLGGYLGINQNLNNANGAANTILFQITGTGQTVLEGPTEMYGQRANFMVANPNGIYVNGGGFYNAPRVTLTTGQPILNQGQLDAIHVAGGTITVGPGGLLALPGESNVDSVELLARGIELNGAIYANQATLVAGRNAIDYAALGSDDPAVMMAGITPLSTEGDAAPSFAIDSSQLGGMYANAIRMVSTEGGVGVRFRAKHLAQSGALFLDANGTIQIADTGALVGNDGVSITGEAVANDGVVLAGDVPTVLGLVSDADGQAADLSITATGTAETAGRVDNTGYLLAGGDLTIEAESIANTGALTTVWLDYDEDAQTWHRRDTGEPVEVPHSAREWRDITDTVTGETHRYYRDATTGDWVHAETGEPLVLQVGEWVYYDGAWRDPDTYDAMDPTGISVAWDDTTYTASAIEWVDAYTPAVIQSGQDMVLDGAVTNALAEIEAGNTLTITGALTNVGQALNQTVAIDAHRWDQTGTKRMLDRYETYSWQHCNRWKRWGFSGCDYVTRYGQRAIYRNDPLYSWVEDPIVHNATRERTVHQGDVVAGTASGQWLDAGRLFVMAAPGSAFMYQLDADYASGAGPYTVDSSYFMTQYGSGVGQRLGDAVFEYLQLRQQYWQAYGEDLDADELKELYDAAVLEGQRHGFIVGQALTAEQQAALGSDIIWLVHQTVNGEQVLAPQLFVANPSASPVNFLTRLAAESIRFESDVHNSSSVFGQSVQLTGASVANTGRIRGGNTVSATLDQLDNQGKIRGRSVTLTGANQLTNAGDIQAEDGLTLSGGAIQNTGRLRGDTVAITDADTVTLTGAIQADTAVNIAVNGDLVVDVVTDTSTDGTSTHTEIRQRGLISGQSVDLRADGHITSTGGVIQGSDSVGIQGDEGVVLGAVEQSHASAHATSISHTGTQLVSGGSAMMQSSAGDVVIQASDVAVVGDMTVDADGDLAITSLEHAGQVHGFQLQDVSNGSMVVGGNANLSGESIAIRGESVVAGGSMTLDATDAVVIESVQKKTKYADSDFTLSREEQVKSAVQSGGDLSVNGRTVEVRASDVVSNGSVSIQADDSVTIESESNTFFSKLHSESSGSFGAKKSKTETIRTRDTVQSNIVGNGVTIESGEDTRIKGSTIQSAGDLSLKANGGIQILNDWDVAERHVEKSETGMGHVSGQSHNQGSVSATVVGSALVADGAVAVESGESMVMQGSAIAGESVDVTAETGVAIVSAENQTQTYDHKKRHGAFGYKKVTEVDTLSVTQTGSAVDAGTDVTVSGGDFLRVAGSSIQANGQVDVAADTIRVEAVEERETRREYEMKQTMEADAIVGSALVGNAIGGPVGMGVGIAVAEHNQNSHETIRDERTMKGSVIAGAGGVNITAVAGTNGTVDIVGSDVVSNGSVSIKADDSVTIESESNTFFSKLSSESSGSFGAKTSKTETVRTRDTVQSTIVGNGVTIESGEDTRIKGSTVQSAGDLSLKANGGIQILNDWDVAERHVEKSETGMGHVSGQSHNQGSVSATVVGSALVADGAVAVEAGESVVMQGSAIAGDSVDVTAETGVAIVSAENQTQTYDHKKRHGAFGYKKVTEVDTLSVTQTGSAVDAGTDVTVSGGDFLRVAGSSIQSKGQVDVAADTIRVEAVEEREYRREYEMKQTMGSVKGVFGSMGDLTEDEQIEAGTQYNQNNHETIRDERTMKGSVIAGAGGVRMTAGAGTDGTVDIVGSDVVSEGAINLSAGGDVTITAAAERLDVTETEQDLSVMVGVVAGNAYVDAVNTVGIVDQANRQLQSANRELKRLESLRAAGKASDRAIELAKANVAVAAANVVAATAQVAKAAKKAANTAKTYGFYGEGLVRTTGTERKQKATTIRHRGSTVSGEAVTIASGGTSGVQGSAVKAEEALRIQAKDVVIESVADRHTHTDKTQAVNGEVRSGDDTSWSLTQSDSKTKQTRIEQVASQLTGKLVAINAEEDLTVAGGVVRGETVAVNAGGDVTVRSMVDVDTMDHTNQSATVGTGTLGGSMGYATHRSERVGTVFSITGETVALEADSVDVVGGVIAATDATGADTGQLTLRANRLTVSDVALKTESERLQLGGRTVGSGASVPAGEAHATGQTTVSLGYGKYDRLDRVNGTIGNGTVEAGNADALDDVNRDVTQVRETVSETDGGSFDASLTVDHRVFSQTGRSEMGSELKELPGNYGRSVRNVAGMPHYARNMLNETQVVDKMRDPDPEKNPDPISPMTKEEAALHQYTIKAGSPENEKYVYNKHEAVYRYNPETGNHDILLKDIPGQAADMGSYNFAAKTYPDDYQGKRDPYPNWWRERAHVIVDALPSIAFGNSPYDQTTIWMRGEESIKALRNYRNKNSNE